MSRDGKLRFETLQLHVGQEKPDPATDARAVVEQRKRRHSLTSLGFSRCLQMLQT